MRTRRLNPKASRPRRSVQRRRTYGDIGAGGEYFLKYEDVRTSPSPRQTLMEFLQSTYDAGATLGKWDRKELER